MKKFFLIIIILNLISTNLINAQYKIKTKTLKSDEKSSIDVKATFCPPYLDGNKIYYTPYYTITAPFKFMGTGFSISYQEIGNQYYIFLKNLLYNSTEVNTSVMKAFSFLFKDGTKIVLDNIPNTWWNYQSGAVVCSFHGGRASISHDQLDVFTKKQLVAISVTYNGSNGFYSSEIPEKRAIKNSIIIAYFLRKEKLKEKDIIRIYNSKNNINNTNNWDY